MVDKTHSQPFSSVIQRHLQLFIRFRYIDIMKMLEYRSSFIFWVLINILWSLFNILFFSILVGVSGSIGGWNRQEVFVLLGIFTIIDAFTWSLFYANMTEYAEDIFNGRLSLLLCRPVNTQFYILTKKLNPQIIFRLMIGAVITLHSLSELDVSLSPLQILLFVFFLMVSLLFLYSFWFMLTTCAFFFERLENLNEIIPSIRRLWQVPRSVYQGAISVSLTGVIPFLLIASLPSEILLNRFSYPVLVYYLGITLIIFFLSKVFFNFAVRHYSGMAN